MTIFLKHLHNERSVANLLSDAIGLVWMKLYKIYPYNIYLETVDIVHTINQQQELQKQIDSFHFGIQPKKQDIASLYVLVIGETARYDHISLNGYQRSTTPLLSQRNHLISYDSAFSQANLTSYSIPLILTRATAQHPETAYKEKSLTEAFQEASIWTGFISKQTPSLLTARIMDNSNYAYFNARNIDVAGNYDEEMVNILHKFSSDTTRFFILHSLGCHSRYELRYPPSFTKFQPTLGRIYNYTLLSKDNKDKIINAYDNAIFYTDYFLNALIQYMDSLNCPTVMMYMSDHRESLWDDENNLFLHGSYQISEYEYHVPMIVWYSDEYEAQYPQKVATMWQNKTKPISSDVIFYSLLDIAGIEDIVDSTRSICSPSLVAMDTVWVHTGSGAVEQMILR